MSEIQRMPLYRNAFDIGNNRSGEWTNLRFMVYRDHGPYLTVGLVSQSRGGHPMLDGRIRGLQVAWDPDLCEGNLQFYALEQALLGVTQTHR